MHESRAREVSPSDPTVQRAVKMKPHTKRHREVSPQLDALRNYKNETYVVRTLNRLTLVLKLAVVEAHVVKVV